MFVPVGDARLYTVAFGPADAPVLVAVGGWIGSWELWAGPFASLSQQWRTIAYDHRGAGATLASVASITPQQLIDDVGAVLDAYDVEQCVLAAESAGAITALGAALQDRDRIRGLVIVDGAYYNAPDTEKSAFVVGLETRYSATLDAFVEACVPEPDSEPVKRWGRQILARAAQADAIALYYAARAIDLRPELPRITQPTLILHGDQDRIVPVAEAYRLAELLPQAQLVVLPGAGHVPTMTRPEEVSRAINAFFGSGG